MDSAQLKAALLASEAGALSGAARSETNPTVQLPRGGTLGIWSEVNSIWRPDVFQLEDGRICRVNIPTTASGDRLSFAVQILTAPLAGGMMSAHSRLPGGAGLMYQHRPSGAWELYPVERTVAHSGGYRRRTAPGGIHCDLQASPRQAALELIVASDEASRSYYDYVGADQGWRVGGWRVKLLAEHADSFHTWRPAPGELRVDAGGRHFLATRYGGTASGDAASNTARIVVAMEQHMAGGYEVRAHQLRLADVYGAQLSPRLDAPPSVVAFCLSRCRL